MGKKKGWGTEKFGREMGCWKGMGLWGRLVRGKAWVCGGRWVVDAEGLGRENGLGRKLGSRRDMVWGGIRVGQERKGWGRRWVGEKDELG